MSFEQKDNTGALFKADKGDNPKRPDYTGKAVVDGTEKRIAAWIKEDRNGNKYMSLNFSDPMARDDRNQSTSDDLNDTVPF